MIFALALACAPPPPDGSVLLVSLDTFRADKIGAYGQARPLTPNLDAFAREGVLFEHAYSQANVTQLSHGSVFTSRHPSELAPIDENFRVPDSATTVAEVFSAYGYPTAAFTGGGELRAEFGLAQGFATFEVPAPMGSFSNTVPPALAWIDEQAKPWFLLVHTYDAHAPYLEPAPHGLAFVHAPNTGAGRAAAATLTGTDRIFGDWLFPGGMIPIDGTRARPWDLDGQRIVAERARLTHGTAPVTEADRLYLRDTYDGAIRYTDDWFGYLMANLRKRGLLDHLTIVVMGDHGEGLGEDGVFNHTMDVDDEELHVPLLIRLPGGAGGGRRVAEPVALLDILPTLTDLVGATPPAGVEGHSLRPWLAGQTGPSYPWVFSEGFQRAVTARSPTARVTFSGVPADSPYLPALLSFADFDGPAWDRSSTNDPAVRTAGRDAMLGWRAALHVARSAPPADPKAVEEMRKRGYWSPN